MEAFGAVHLERSALRSRIEHFQSREVQSVGALRGATGGKGHPDLKLPKRGVAHGRRSSWCDLIGNGHLSNAINRDLRARFLCFVLLIALLFVLLLGLLEIPLSKMLALAARPGQGHRLSLRVTFL